MHLSTALLHLWLATSLLFLDFAAAQHAHHHSSGNPHHDHDHHDHHHRYASKRTFGKAMRVWTPAQGPARRSASVDGRALEPFVEDAIPGWTFSRVYDIPHWDGGDKAACRITHTSSIVESADKPRSPERFATFSFSVSDFCTEGNPPVEPPDDASCKSAPKLVKRIIPTFGQIDDIVRNAIAAGKEVHMARVQAGIPDRPPPRPGLAGPGAVGATGSAAGAGVGSAAGGAAGIPGAPAGLNGAGAGSGVGALTGSQGVPAGMSAAEGAGLGSPAGAISGAGDTGALSALKGLLGGVGAGGASPMSHRSISVSYQDDKNTDAQTTDKHAQSQSKSPSPGKQDGRDLTKRLLFGWIEDIVNNAISAGKDVDMARIQSGAGTGERPPSLTKRLIPSADQIAKFVAGLQGNVFTSHDSAASEKSSPPAMSSSLDRTTGSSSKNLDTKVHQLIGGDNSPTAQWSGSVPAAQNTKPLPGTFLIAQGKSSAEINHQAASRRGISKPEVSQVQLYDLVSAAFRTASEINAASASRTEHGKAKRGTSQVVLQRSPLGPMMAMEGMMGGGGSGIMTIITTLMPAILAAIKAAGEVGVAFIQQFNEAVQVEKLKGEAQRNATMLEEDKLKEMAGGRSTRTSAETQAKAASSSRGSKRELETHASWASELSSSDRCGGTARLCMGLIQSALEFCLPDGQHTPQEDRYHHTSSNLVRTMTAHCLLKCDGFGQVVKTDRPFESKAERCTGDTHLLQKILSLGRTNPSQRAKDGVQSDSLRKRSQSPDCQAGYQSVFTDARRPVASYSNKRFGSVVSDPTAFLHWGLVSSVSQCLSACDATSGCVFVNIYQQTFNLDNPLIKLINRSPDATTIKAIPEDDWERTEGARLKRKFAAKREDKKNSFVQGQLTCALYSRCHAECDANKASGSGEPIFFENSEGWCKSKDCDGHGEERN